MSDKEYALIIGGLGDFAPALAPKLNDEGFHVVFGDAVVSGKGVFIDPVIRDTCQLYKLDATKPKSINHFRHKIERAGISLSHVVNLMAGPKETSLTDIFKTSEKEIRSTIEWNLMSQIFPVRYLGEHLKETQSKNKSFTLISSINAQAGYSIPFFSAAQGGVHSFIRPAAIELGTRGVRINIVKHGTVKTPSTKKQPKNYKARAEAAALKRLCNPKEIADGILSCIKLTGMTGQEIVIDAGQSVNPSESLYDQYRRDPPLGARGNKRLGDKKHSL
jgi:NAD(P)-dependent dehydrogenase (short-subunit alcohol dehydrogenase family)